MGGRKTAMHDGPTRAATELARTRPSQADPVLRQDPNRPPPHRAFTAPPPKPLIGAMGGRFKLFATHTHTRPLAPIFVEWSARRAILRGTKVDRARCASGRVCCEGPESAPGRRLGRSGLKARESLAEAGAGGLDRGPKRRLLSVATRVRPPAEPPLPCGRVSRHGASEVRAEVSRSEISFLQARDLPRTPPSCPQRLLGAPRL